MSNKKVWNNDIIQHQSALSDTSDMLIPFPNSPDLLDESGSGALPLSDAHVLVVYYGGTIGMRREHNVGNRGYVPERGNLFNVLKSHPSFHDRQAKMAVTGETGSNAQTSALLCTPPSVHGRRVLYRLYEHDDPMDSSNLTPNDWIIMANIIKDNYDSYDAFIVLHGTDTMCYSASVLAFILEGLTKTVILTGSQIPFSEVRNDAVGNMLGALMIAGHYRIPEVCLFFDNRLFRGCRSTKASATAMQAFDSPNSKPLAIVGVTIDIDWVQVRRSEKLHSITSGLRVSPLLQQDQGIGVIRFWPGISDAFLNAACQACTKGLILQTYGTGNIPTCASLLDILERAVKERDLIIINCTQCYKGSVLEIYATGKALMEIGVIPGFDMTIEATLAKLTYLLGKADISTLQIRQMMMEDLRGELTPLHEEHHRLIHGRETPLSSK